MDSISIIDISAFIKSDATQRAKEEVVKKWDEAFQSSGFVTIVGHGVSEGIVEELRMKAKEFFRQKLEHKMKSCLHQGYGKGGYVPAGVESVSRSLGPSNEQQPTDLVETSDANIVPDFPSEFNITIQRYWQEMNRLLSIIMEISSLALGLPKDYFKPYYENPNLFLRLAYYPSLQQKEISVATSLNQMRYGAHKDYDSFTILKQDDKVGGLEVFNSENESWVPVELVENSFVINVGPSPDSILSPMEKFADAEEAVPKPLISSIMAGDFLNGLPSFNKDNFTKFHADGNQAKNIASQFYFMFIDVSKRPTVYIQFKDDVPIKPQVIITDKTNILLRYLRQQSDIKTVQQKRSLSSSDYKSPSRKIPKMAGSSSTITDGEQPRMLLCFLLLLCIASISECSSDTSDVLSSLDNFRSAIAPSLTALSNDFDHLNTSCFKETKSTLIQLEEAVKEGKKCEKQASIMLNKLEKMCKYLKPLNGFVSKFDKVMKILKLVLKSLNKMTKFADNIPKIGTLRKIIVEKVLPMILKIMEKLNKQIRKIIDFEKAVLKFKKPAKLLWKIDKNGAKVCKLSSPVAVSLKKLKEIVNGFNNISSRVLPKPRAQKCMTQYCLERGGGSSCRECGLVEKGFVAASPKISKWKKKMTKCHQTLSKANSILARLNVISTVANIGEKILKLIEEFLKPISDKFAKFAKYVSEIASNLMSCCPCGRPNLKGCLIETVGKTINLLTCPLDAVSNVLVKTFTDRVEKLLSEIFNAIIPKIDININIPAIDFRLSLPNSIKTCLGLSNKVAVFRAKSIQLTIHASLKSEKFVFPNAQTFGKEIKKSCNSAVNAFKKIGTTMKTCFDTVEDFFFAIPLVGFIAAATCDPNYKDPDPGINYCRCKSGKNYCVVWHESWKHTCKKSCKRKNYKYTNKWKMATKEGYAPCNKLKYYCHKKSVVVENGYVECKNSATQLGGSCKIKPKRGYVCPIDSIHCGTASKGKSVCWDYPSIRCAKDNGKRFPVCKCRNKCSFKEGEVVCQTPSTSSADNPKALKEIGHSVSCFRPLGRYNNIKADCGNNMIPCVMELPNVDAYASCSRGKSGGMVTHSNDEEDDFIEMGTAR
eukprot:gene10096-11127_t